MTVAGVLLLAIVDSINPSAIVVTLYLLSIPGRRAFVQVLVYVGAIFVTYLLFGMLMVTGIGVLMPSPGSLLDSLPGLAAQSVVGLALLAYSVRASPNAEPSRPVAIPAAGTYAALVMLGVSITVVELSTAIPYFAAIAFIVDAELPIRTWMPLLVAYNVIFVLPPIALLVGHLALQKRLAEPYAALRRRLERGARETMLWIAGLVGGGLFATGTIELVARLR